MASFALLAKKELKLLLRERMILLTIILPFVMYSLMSGLAGSAVKQTTQAYQLKGVSVAIVPGAPSEEPAARILEALMKRAGVNVTLARGEPRSLLKVYDVVLYIPKGFMENITRGEKGVLDVYIRGSVSRLNYVTALPGGVSAFVSRLAVKGGVTTRVYIQLDSRMYTIDELTGIVGTAFTLSFMAFFVIFPAASVAAVLIGSEKEERMLDILLSLPVKRGEVALAKMIAAIVVGLATALSAGAGFYTMISRLAVAASGSKAPSPLLLKWYTPSDLALYFAAVLLSAMFAAAAALTLSLFAETTRGAQSLAFIVALPIFAFMAIIYQGVSLNPLVYVVPYMCVAYAAFAPLLGPLPALYSILAQLAETVAVAYVFVKLLSSEAAVTAAAWLKQRLARRR